MIRYLLDTNVVIYAIKNRPQSLRQKFNRLQGQMAISSVTWGELIYGVERSAQPERNLADIESLGTRLEIMPFDQVAASHFGRIRAELYRVQEAHWLTERFPDAALRDVEGLVKLADRAEIEANDWSLTPGRYVGIAPEEEDEDFDFREALREIHAELEGLDAEAATLAATIKHNFKALGI